MDHRAAMKITRTDLKKRVQRLLAEKNLNDIFLELSGYREEDLINPLFSSLCNSNEIVRWHAVSAFGIVVSQLAKRNLESARVIMRRFLWSLNDESGGIGWGAPEAMAEIMANHPVLADEYLHMLVSYIQEDGDELYQDGNFIELPMLQRGILWGIGRLAGGYRQRLIESGVAKELAKYLESPDLIVFGLALWCYIQLRIMPDGIPKERICGSADIPIYHEGVLRAMQLSELLNTSATVN